MLEDGRKGVNEILCVLADRKNPFVQDLALVRLVKRFRGEVNKLDCFRVGNILSLNSISRLGLRVKLHVEQLDGLFKRRPVKYVRLELIQQVSLEQVIAARTRKYQVEEVLSPNNAVNVFSRLYSDRADGVFHSLRRRNALVTLPLHPLHKVYLPIKSARPCLDHGHTAFNRPARQVAPRFLVIQSIEYRVKGLEELEVKLGGEEVIVVRRDLQAGHDLQDAFLGDQCL